MALTVYFLPTFLKSGKDGVLILAFPVLAAELFSSLYTGFIILRNGDVWSRKKDPYLYWSMTFLSSLICLFMWYFFIHIIIHAE
jgi:hypothetical protein